MARSTQTTAAAAKPKPAAGKATPRAKPVPVAPTPVPSPPARVKAGNTAMKTTVAEAAASRTPVAAPTATVAARIPKPSKGELRAHIEKLEAANAVLKAKSRETNRAAKAANQRIEALEAEVARLQEQTARPAAAAKASKVIRRARQPRGREIDPGDAVPPGVAVLEPEPLDAEAEAARDALEDKLSGP